MKEIAELHIPDDRRYAPTHEWVKLEGDRMRVGISDYAQDQLGDVVFVELPEVGARFEQGKPFGIVESVKAVSDLYLPVTGEVVEANQTLETQPQLVNESPYDEGWLMVVQPGDPEELSSLLTAEQYLATLEEND
jgi:glycine cleavage system H protein